MRYSLVICKDNEFFEITNYSKIDGFEHIKEDTIEGIINFTNMFESEEELIEFLLYFNLIPSDFRTGSFHINFQKGKNNTPKLLQYGISFKEDKKFFDLSYLINYYYHKLSNPTFFDAFLNKYYNYLKDVSAFEYYLNTIKRSYKNYLKDGILPLEANDAVTNFITKYCSTKDSKGGYKISMPRIRDLAMFAINYERTYIREKKKNIYQDEKYLQNLQNLLDHYETIIREDNLTEEELEAYTLEINKLENEIERLTGTDFTRKRRNEFDETTTN